MQPNIYACSIDKDEYLKNTRMYLAVSAGTGEADLIGRVPHLVKICSGDYIDRLVQNALPGVALTHSVSPPSAIPLKLNYQYFSLSQSGGPWETILRARNLAAYVPGDFPVAAAGTDHPASRHGSELSGIQSGRPEATLLESHGLHSPSGPRQSTKRGPAPPKTTTPITIHSVVFVFSGGQSALGRRVSSPASPPARAEAPVS